ncbi:hypothetical protein ASPZODRAFT_126244 [Penicilliopsis zonata CBS 506.65]|uniref:Tat pathway signal sequence n=1 Tax=Penicilliopsis zonata CBS 506.65 TaxID=1073090 RepID=A0A1L9S4B8_9EURO|nr:hypothetical protein ASPZODRAFT_126244 [Penicilliopsis zonata CBS 506.65]OJJ42008.1 hypothetical protein ASPZODRAFT_126244 [Penicilliopsis zonata CBS 506.65]
MAVHNKNHFDGIYSHSDLNVDLKKTSAYSPLFDLLDLRGSLYQINGRIHDKTSIFRQDPSPEVDRAWDHISAEGKEIILVPGSAVSKSQKETNISVKAPTSWGGGENLYIAQIDVFHQIHCLNELRKEIWFDYYYGDNQDLSKTSNSSFRRSHLDHKSHCIHMLLQTLMCHADVDIITHNWVHYNDINQPSRPYAEPFADFNMIKKCRNFDHLLSWVEEHAVRDLAKKWHDLRMPEGATLVQDDGYF